MVSQSAGVIIGHQDSVDLKAALTSGVTTAASFGLNHTLSNAGFNAASGKGLNPTGAALQAGGTALAGNAANKILGNPSGFSWAGIAATMGSAAIGNAAGLGDPANDTERLSTQGVINDTLGGIVRSTISHVLRAKLPS